MYEKELTIPADSFLYSREYKKFVAYKIFREAFQIKSKHHIKYVIDSKTITTFINSNPEYWETYFILGNYYRDENNAVEALKYYNLALTKEITTMQDKEAIEKNISEVESLISEVKK